MYQRKWYVARAATNEEIPKSLANKLSKAREKSMVVQFAIDEDIQSFQRGRLSHLAIIWIWIQNVVN